MRTAIAVLFAATACGFADPSDDYVNFIRQTQADSGVEWDVTVASQGASLSPEGVGDPGSFFQLWSIHSPNAKSYLLDEQYVSSYLPSAQVTINTGDPYTSVPRTRVDQPFSVTITVAGLYEGTDLTDVPDAALNIAFAHSVVGYPDGEFTLPAGASSPIMIQEGYVKANGDTVVKYELTNLTAGDLTKAAGEERFTVSSLADYGIAASVMDSKRVQIWPIASGSIAGLSKTIRYTDIPPITLTLDDLYPASETYVRAYRGSPSSSPVEPFLLEGSYVLLADSIPQARQLLINDVNDFFTKEGPYTLEIIHETPFGYDILDQHYPLLVDRTIEVKAAMFTGGQ